jgi:hypothetical protein
MTKHIYIILWACIMTSCFGHKDNKLKTVVRYINESGYNPNSFNDLRDSTLIFVFTFSFKNDLVEIKTSDISKSIRLNTNQTTGHAEIVSLGKLNINKEVILKLNNNESARIKVNLENQIFVVKYYGDSLFVESVYHIPSFF